MSRLNKLSLWASVLTMGLVLAFATVYVSAIHGGISHAVALRTYVFWALVCAPVAYVVEMLFRSAREYRLVRVAIDRVALAFRDR